MSIKTFFFKSHSRHVFLVTARPSLGVFTETDLFQQIKSAVLSHIRASVWVKKLFISRVDLCSSESLLLNLCISDDSYQFWLSRGYFF